MEPIDLHHPGFDINLEMLINTYYQLQFFTSLKLSCIITKSSDDKFLDYVQTIEPNPFTIFHFFKDNSKRFLALCCQNLCILIEIDDDRFIQVFQDKFIHKILLPSTSKNDVLELSSYIDLRAVTIPNKKDQKNLFYDIGKIKEIFIPRLFTPEYSDENDDWTLSKFLYLSFDTIIAYSIQRFYYPTADFHDPSFFTALNPEEKYREFNSEEFKFIHHIGAGNTGSITLAIHIETGFIVALKSMKSKTTQSSYEKKFHQLYRHPFILHCYGEYKTGSFIVLVTDYMCNGDLDEYCRDQSLDPTSKTKAIAEILCGIDYLHSNGVMHRDLKPKNILISHDKDFIISDFDTAIRYTSDKNKGTVGTFPFMAREVFTGDGISFQTDLYSFGIIIYELALGENPFENLSIQDAIENITDGKIQQLPPKCGTIAKLYKRCTEDLKNKRASSFYLFEMLFNEILFFSNSNEDYIFNLYNRIKEMQSEFQGKGNKVRDDVQFIIDNAQKGELYSMFNLAVMYHNGWGNFAKDYTKALEWFSKSAALGHPASIYDIGNMYYRQRGVPRDLEKAFDYYQKSADLNFIEGYNGLGNMYYNGEVPIKDGQYDPETNLPLHFYPPDYKKAYECYKYAADRGHSYALCNCGHGFYEGKFCGGKPDYEKAVMWYEKASEVGNKDAEYNLGEIYLNGLLKTGSDAYRAFSLFKQSAAQSQPKAVYQVARMLRDGVGTDQNYHLSANYYRKSVCLKNKDAMYDLANLILEGKVDRKDYCDNPENKTEKTKIGLKLFVGDEDEVNKNYDKANLTNDAINLLKRYNGELPPAQPAAAQTAPPKPPQMNLEAENSFEDFTEAIKCPICYLAMTPPKRTPMIIPECGHTICLQCITKVDKCPICKQRIKVPLKNITVCQIADNLQKKGLLPYDSNPPPVQKNNLIPKIEGLCTSVVSSGEKLWQKVYQCKTCKVTGLCEPCTVNCHQGHDILFITDDPVGSCICDKLCKSNERPLKIRCTSDMTYNLPADQPMYYCLNCKMNKDDYICQYCAMSCHSQHNIRYVGIMKNKLCKCYENGACQITKRKPVCSFYYTGTDYIKQPFYHCIDCGLVENYGVCSVCAKVCHKDHEVYFDKVMNEAYCDCHEKGCTCSNYPNTSYLNKCTNLDILSRNVEKVQRMYHCNTCSIIGSAGICEACAVNCHINHIIEYDGLKSFVCSCNVNGECLMKLVPLIHDDRDVCDRKVLGENDASACYTCYSCDPSGKTKICETCALKIHNNHDVHLVGYFAFKCSEGGDFRQNE